VLLFWIVACLQAEGEAPGGPAATGPQSLEEIPLVLRVHHAIALGVGYLEGQQDAEGSFPGHEDEHPGGMTALAAYTLLRSGSKKDSPAVAGALAALDGQVFESTYSASVHLLLCEALGEPARAAEARRSLDLLLDGQERGVWSYPWGNLDNSNTQFALLALRSARRMGLEVPEAVLVEALRGLALFERGRGGYTYGLATRETYGGMTAATLASIGVLQEAAASGSGRLRAALEKEARAIGEAERWMEERFDASRNPNGDGTWRSIFHYPYLWALERWCGLTDRQTIAGHDWYAEGAEWLLAHQARNGAFGLDTGLENTCFALLFLRRATLSHDEGMEVIDERIERLRPAPPRLLRRRDDRATRLTDFWLAGPFDQGTDEPLLLDPPFDPAEVAPRAHGKLARSEWRRVTLGARTWTDLEVLLKEPGDRRLWVLSSWLQVPGASGDEPLEAVLWLEADDGWDLWLDGQRLSRERRKNGIVTADASFPVRLAPGEHRITVVVEDLKGPSAFGLRIGPGESALPTGFGASAEPTSAKK
jgi:hypothetical protein